MRRNIVLGIILVVSAVIFVWGARQQSSLVNTNMYEMDQSAYMLYAINLAETNFTYVGDRNRMPLYPMLMSFFYKQGMSDEVFFERGKKAGIAIGLIGILVTFLLFKHVSNTMEALTGTLVAAFTMFAYKAPYFQAEVLFYPISLFLFYLLLSLVKKPKIKTAILAGFVGGIGHLTKASVLPAVLVASVIVLLRGVISHWRKHRNADKAVINLQESNALWKSASNIVVLLFCFHLVIYPYIRTSKERFGRYYYNVNSTFYMWYDSWEEAELGTKAHGDRQCWPDMPSEDIPSFKKYMSEHTLGDIFNRFLGGFCEMKDRIIQSYGYAEFIIIYGIAITLLIYQNKETWLSMITQRGHPYVLLFVLGYFVGYVLLYTWYSPIAGGNRFVLSLFLPAMLLIVWSLSYAQKQHLRIILLGREVSAPSISVVVVLYLIPYLAVVFPTRISSMFGGS